MPVSNDEMTRIATEEAADFVEELKKDKQYTDEMMLVGAEIFGRTAQIIRIMVESNHSTKH